MVRKGPSSNLISLVWAIKVSFQSREFFIQTVWSQFILVNHHLSFERMIFISGIITRVAWEETSPRAMSNVSQRQWQASMVDHNRCLLRVSTSSLGGGYFQKRSGTEGQCTERTELLTGQTSNLQWTNQN